MRIRLYLLFVFVLIWAGFIVLGGHGVPLHTMASGKTLAGLLSIVFAIAAVYELCALAVGFVIWKRKGAPSEVNMLASLLRAAAVMVVLVWLLYFFGVSGQVGTVAAGFAGMLMGWSLQAPVSGLVAWALVNLYRPFRVSDRVMLPAWGLTGDVRQIGMMYTVLDQIGGTVGSEEAAHRDILIPNAMLFGNIVINYTPTQTAAFLLDEIIVRITHSSNWDKAEKVCIDAAREVTVDIIKATGQEPYIRADMYDYGIYLRLRYMTDAVDRPRISYEITKRIFREFQEHADLDWAIPYIYSHRAGRRAGARHLEPARDVTEITVEVSVKEVHDPAGVGSSPENAAQVNEVAKAIAERGLLQPIIVEKRPDGQYNVVAGHMRLAACKMLGWESVPAIVSQQSESASP